MTNNKIIRSLTFVIAFLRFLAIVSAVELDILNQSDNLKDGYNTAHIADPNSSFGRTERALTAVQPTLIVPEGRNASM